MDDPLATYLHDHLSGARGAIDLLETMRKHHEGEPLGGFADDLLQLIEEDRQVLRGLAEKVGTDSSPLKEAGAWLGEKASRVKLRQGSEDGLGTLMALETLSLGILGKRALWAALSSVSADDDRLHGVDFNRLISRAESQHEMAEERRLQHVRIVFIGR